MNVEAMAWAFSVDMDHASHKFLLVTLANCAGASMTAWPSIEYLCKVTCLNRKTVIDGLKRLRDMGLIERTGEMIGRTGQVPIYRIVCSNSPKNGTSAESGTGSESGTSTENGTQPVPKTVPVPVPKTVHGKVLGKVKDLKDVGTTTRGSRLPDGWEPSPDLRAWAASARPDLDLDDVLEQFRDYYHAAPGQRGVSVRWDLTYRNWVKKQWHKQGAATQKPKGGDSLSWLASDRATEAKGRELGMTPRPGEDWEQYRARIRTQLRRQEETA